MFASEAPATAITFYIEPSGATHFLPGSFLDHTGPSGEQQHELVVPASSWGTGSYRGMIPIENDTADEADGTLVFTFTEDYAGGLFHAQADAQFSVTVTDDDPLPVMSITDASGGEDSELVFNVQLSVASGKTVTVQYVTTQSTQGTSAVAGTDYTSIRGTLTFQPGEQRQGVTVVTLANTDDDEELFTP